MISLPNYRKFPLYFLNNSLYFKKQGWVRSIFWDGFWLHSGFWLTLLLININSSFFHEIIYTTGVFIFWIAHRFSSFYIAWGTKAYRKLCINQRIRFVIFPFLLVIGVFFVIYFVPKTLLPFTMSERIFGFFMIDFAWGVHHFAAQHYGILRLYDQIWNPRTYKLAKKQDRIFCWGVGGFMVILAELLHGTSYLQERQIIPILSSDLFFFEISFFQRLGAFIVFGLTFYMIINEWYHQSSLPRILYILGIGMMVISAFQLDPFQFFMLWTLQHWMVSLGLVSHMGGNDIQKSKRKESLITEKFPLINFSKRYLLLFFLFIFSFVMTPFFEIEAVSIDKAYSEKLMPTMILFLRESDFRTFLIGLGLSTGFLHYWMDRAVFRFSDPETCKSAKKLFFKL